MRLSHYEKGAHFVAVPKVSRVYWRAIVRPPRLFYEARAVGVDLLLYGCALCGQIVRAQCLRP